MCTCSDLSGLSDVMDMFFFQIKKMAVHALNEAVNFLDPRSSEE
jgi:hypothetical protein